jgi:exosortase/archaeosortase family protein
MKRKPKIGLPVEGGSSIQTPGPRPFWFVIRFIAGLALGQIAIAYFPPIEGWAVSTTVASLRLFAWCLGLHGAVEGDSFGVGGGSVRIVGECTPVMPTLVLTAAIAAYPSMLRSQLLGILAGAVVIWAFNLARIATLAVVIAWRPQSFDFIHMYLWQTITLFIVLLIFLLWVRVQSPRRETT